MSRVTRIAQSVAVTAAASAAFVVPAQAATTPHPFTNFSQPKVSWDTSAGLKHGTPLPFPFRGAY
jgi:hypothetical protein